MQKAGIGKYIYSKRHGLVMFGVCVGIFALVFALCAVPLRYVWYPTLLCLCFFVVYALFDYYAFRKHHKMLVNASHAIEVAMENLPEAKSLLEDDYQQLLASLNSHKNATIAQNNQTAADLEEYLTLWSHQIKTPLTSLGLTCDGIAEPERSQANEQVFEIEQYVDMMLQYLRLRDKSTDLVLHPYSLRSMVNQAVKYYAKTFIHKKLSVQIEIDETLKVTTDEKWLVFVLKQLLSNALKYTENGTIAITAVASQEQENEVALTITDTGIGIAKEDLPRIFERGYTGYNGRKDKKATGLGLYLTEQVLAMLGHKITIESTVNVGTAVTIKL